MTTTFQTPIPIPAGGARLLAPARLPRHADGRVIAAALEANRRAVALRLLESVRNFSKYSWVLDSDVNALLQREFYAQVDYLSLYFRTGDLTYRDLYIGEKIKQAYHDPETSADQQISRRRQISEADRQGLLHLLSGEVTAKDAAYLDSELKAIAGMLTFPARYTPQVLFIGDCLFLDVMAFLPGATAQDEIAVSPTFISSKNPTEVRKQLRELSDRKFDLIFYSPFTYEFSPPYSRLMDWRQGSSSARKVRELADSAMENVSGTIDLLGDLFECNIFVHNSANIRRHNSTLGERGKCLLTHRSRRMARSRVNERLQEIITARNAATFEHIILFNELPLLHRHGQMELGRMFYNSDLQHPAVMGKWVAQEYRNVLAVQCRLLQKKLVVCDLDNTLWDGVIGEGKVAQHLDRQNILKALKARGIVLAISSKNDAKNIHWTGSALSSDDFVCSQINWESKSSNVKRIAEVLNLKAKDFVFIDDRADEREMMNLALPDVLALDANDPRTWSLMDRWSRDLPQPDQADRTQLYKQREVRESFLQSSQEQDQGALFQKLQIEVTLRCAQKADVKRVVELINRTNQFNTCGSRTTIRQVMHWLASPDYRILLVDAGDKFGPMGIVSVAVVQSHNDRIEIPVFVLSCRVFGYGIETVMLNAAKRLAATGDLPIIAPFQTTPHNAPCQKVYPTHGFAWNGTDWTYRANVPIQDPTWLSVSCQLPVAGR